MDKSENGALIFSLRLLKFTGLHPGNKRAVFVVATLLYLVLTLSVFSFLGLQFSLTSGNLISYLETFESFSGYIQEFAKILTCAIKKNELQQLIVSTEQFWSTNMCAPEIKANLDAILSRTLRLSKGFVITLLLTTIAIDLHPYFTKQLPLGMWTLEGNEALYNIILGVQEVAEPFIALHMAAFDLLYLSFCMSLLVQFKILNSKIRELSVEEIDTEQDRKNYMEKMLAYIRHHTFLLRFSKEMSDMYSFTLLNEYATLLLVLCAGFFVVFESDSFVTQIRHVLVATTVIVQFSFYCIPLDYITEEELHVAHAIYESDWHSRYFRELKSIIPIVIQRAQRDLKFTAGGLYAINSGALINVIRLAWSVCVVFRSMKNL